MPGIRCNSVINVSWSRGLYQPGEIPGRSLPHPLQIFPQRPKNCCRGYHPLVAFSHVRNPPRGWISTGGFTYWSFHYHGRHRYNHHCLLLWNLPQPWRKPSRMRTRHKPRLCGSYAVKRGKKTNLPKQCYTPWESFSCVICLK